STRALAQAVGAARSDIRVETAFLDFEPPGLVSALSREADRGQRAATVVPLLLIAAYHGRVDVPGEIERGAGRGLAVGVARVLGRVGGARSDAVALDLVVRALQRRLAEMTVTPVDGLVLAAAGTRDESALATVDLVAQALGETVSLPCLAGYASGVGRTTGAAVRVLQAGGAERSAVAGHFLAPGRPSDRAGCGARAARRPGSGG